MPYRIRELDRNSYIKLSKAWMINSINMVDVLRDDRVLDYYLDQPDTAWYNTKRDNVFFWLSSINKGHMAEFHVLNAEGSKAADNPSEYFPVLREIFTEFNLQRLSAAVPISLPQVISGAKKLMFRTEGRIRKGSFFNGKFTDVEILGLLREDVPEKEKRHRIRNKNRRKRPSGKFNQKNKKAA